MGVLKFYSNKLLYRYIIKNGGGHIEHCNLAWATAHHFNTIER